MLLVKTYIKESSIPNAGMGCFANEFIPKGTKIWELKPNLDRIITQEEFDTYTELEKEFILIYSYMYEGTYHLCIDNARFFNHSSKNHKTLDPTDELVTYAKRDIEKHEEILSDYRNFGITEDDKKFNSEVDESFFLSEIHNIQEDIDPRDNDLSVFTHGMY